MDDFPAAFVARLADTPVGEGVCNPFAAGDNPYHALRRANLTRCLRQMQAQRPTVALLMEAPGYRGMRLTGVPVTSRRLLLDDSGWYGQARGYQDVPEPGFEDITGEQTATIVYTTFRDAGLPQPFIWNTFPFHPHIPGTPRSNRTPRRAEVAAHLDVLRALMRVLTTAFPVTRVLAVGNVAADALETLGVPVAARVRHPAQGGKNDFVRGIHAALKS